jgi:predicted esterase
MPPRLPTKSDFPPSLTLDIVPPPTGIPANILLLFHGIGDTQFSFTSLAKNLNLPSTACISIRGPNPIPSIFTGSDAPAFHWGDDVLFDEQKGEIDLDTGFKTSTTILSQDVIRNVLMRKCGYEARDILMLGFGQGGMAALGAIAAVGNAGGEFAGVVSIGGKLPSFSSSKSTTSLTKNKTPILVLGGGRSKEITRNAIDKLKEVFGDVEYVKWAKNEDSMPRNREEMLPVMKFFARRLKIAAPDGTVEVS